MYRVPAMSTSRSAWVPRCRRACAWSRSPQSSWTSIRSGGASGTSLSATRSSSSIVTTRSLRSSRSDWNDELSVGRPPLGGRPFSDSNCDGASRLPDRSLPRTAWRDLVHLSWNRVACDLEVLLPGNCAILVADAAAEAANQVSYREGHRGSRVRALLDGCTQEVVGLVGTFADGFRGVGRRLLRLSVDILQRTLHLLGLALQLGLYVAGRSSKSLFHLAAKVFGVAGKTIFIHGRSPSEIRNVNGRGGCRFPRTLRNAKGRSKGRSKRRSKGRFGAGGSGELVTPLEQACDGRAAPRSRPPLARVQTIPCRRRRRERRRPAVERACASRRHGSLEWHCRGLWGRSRSRFHAPPVRARPVPSCGNATTDSKRPR